MRTLRAALISLFLASLATVAPARLNGQAANQASAALTNQDVADMMKAGLSLDVMLAKIKGGPCNFDTSPAALKELKDSGVPDNVILAMVAAPAAAKAAPAAAAAEKMAASSEPAHLRVYRARRYVGSALAPSIYVDGKQIARVGNGRRCSIRLSPGTHTIGSDDKSSSISVEVKGGEDYYVRVDEETGFWKGHGKLTMLAREQGSAEYKLQKPVEEDRKVTKDMIEADSE